MRTIRSSSAVPSYMTSLCTLDAPQYADVHEAASGSTRRSPDQWARRVFEDAPPPTRWFLLTGWRWALGLRLAPRPSPAHVLGWAILARTDRALVIETRSPVLAAQQVFWVGDACLRQATFVRYENRVGALLWPPVSVIHRRVVPYLLRRAVVD